MSDNAAERNTSTNRQSVDAYARRVSRMAVIASWLNAHVAGDIAEHDPLLVEAIEFLHEEIFECRREQDELFHEAAEPSNG